MTKAKAEDVYGWKVNNLTNLLCQAMQVIEVTRDHEDFPIIKLVSPELWEWWQKHKKIDKERENERSS